MLSDENQRGPAKSDLEQAHNLKVVGSNPTPATTFTELSNDPGTSPPVGSDTNLTISPISSTTWPPATERTSIRSIRPSTLGRKQTLEHARGMSASLLDPDIL